MRYGVDDLMALNMAGIGYEKLKKMLPSVAKSISKRQNLQREWRLVKKHKVNVISIFDRDYPEILKNIYSPPIILYVKGNIAPQDKTAVAFVGSRKASHYGINMCQKLSAGLAGLGATIVSGLARGIDSAAHNGALSSEGRTLAVLGNGLAAVYPPENKRLADEIVHSGALISEFPMETPPYRQNFPIRNRIISGLSLGVIIVEAAKKSGALITAACALEQGRDVFAVPGKAGIATSMGTHRLIKEGARLVENIDDIIDELNLISFATDTSSNAKANGTKLNTLERKIYDILSDEPEHIDDIMQKAELPVSEVMTLLLKLEVKRLIKELPGKNFVTIN